MVLLHSLCFGSNQTPEHSEGTGSCDVIRHSKGVQDQHWGNHREFDHEVPRRKQKRIDSSPSNSNDLMLEGWSKGRLGNRRRSSFGITTLTNRSDQRTPKSEEKGSVG